MFSFNFSVLAQTDEGAADQATEISAEDAVSESYIPQTATLKRKETKLDINYDGDPKFEPVKNTSLEYAVNTSNTIIKFNLKYYACVNGAWFISDTPNGPWIVCTNVPDEIYKIPPENPNYNSTFVHVYDYDDNYVNVGYTSGYLGSYAVGGCIMFGTGFAYGSWLGNRWCPRPVTYGCRFRYNNINGSWRSYDRYRMRNGKFVAWNNRNTTFRKNLPGRAYGSYLRKNNFIKPKNAYTRNKLAVKGAIVRNGKIGSNKKMITSDEGDKTDASFTNDGLFIIYSCDSDLEFANIYKISIDGGNPVRLTNYDGYDGAPSVSPDGSKLAFESYSGDPDDSEGTSIFILEIPN